MHRQAYHSTPCNPLGRVELRSVRKPEEASMEGALIADRRAAAAAAGSFLRAPRTWTGGKRSTAWSEEGLAPRCASGDKRGSCSGRPGRSVFLMT
mmetsp:Transcript_47038/g.97629  ORF Transcript_47038/g.97629 Transcript_47038/m.97629 type:complete len:95 (+) Transcript_47038:6-290(+)